MSRFFVDASLDTTALRTVDRVVLVVVVVAVLVAVVVVTVMAAVVVFLIVVVVVMVAVEAMSATLLLDSYQAYSRHD
jgi:hypothetical protein